MTNICIELDSTAMFRGKLTLYRSNANVVLCPQSIATKYIIAAKYFIQPRHTLYKRPTEKALSIAHGKNACAPTATDHMYSVHSGV